jgi:tRNA-dihydrouridine synthase B
MIGRAAQGKPWLCGQIAAHLDTGVTPPAPSPLEQLLIMRAHVEALHAFYGEFMGLRIARKHVGWYLQDNPGYLQQRRIFNRLESAADQLDYLQQMTGNHPHQHHPDKEIAA